MSETPHIILHIRASQLDADGKYQQATIGSIEDTTGTLMGLQYEKYMLDIVAHALAISNGVEVKKATGFPYKFSFKLGKFKK